MRYAVLILVSVLCAGAALRAPSSPSVGVVDMGQVLSSCAKWEDMQKLILQTRELRKKEVDGLADQAEKLREELEKLAPGSEAYARAQADLIQKEALVATMSEQYDLELARSEDAQFEGIAAEISGVVAEIAKERDCALVLQRAMEVPEGVWESVLYADPRVDLTAAVTERLNASYKAEKK